MEKVLKRLVWLIMAAPAIYLALVWNSIPERVALHFNWNGKADRIGSRNELISSIIILSILMVFIYLLLVNIYRIDPKKYAAENRTRLQRLGFGMTVFMSALSCMIIYSAVKGSNEFSSAWVFSGTGLLFAFIGNYMPNIKPNYFAGFRLPWTLENEDNWKKTHALVGKLWFPGGLLIAVVCIFLPPKISFIFFITVMCIITIIPIFYSYRYYIEQKRAASKPDA